MRNIKWPLLVLLLALLIGISFRNVNAATPPSLTLTNSLTSNQIAVVMGSASDNALITATCTGGDVCQIWEQGGASYLASGTTTATLAYNALAGSATTGIYANDITAGNGHSLLFR